MEKFLSYSFYNNYKTYNTYNMEITTIAITKDIKEKIKEFGSKGESYTEIIERLIKSAKERQLHDLLFDEEDTIPIEEALSNAKKRWQK